jgi:glycosyltransferase involved in cell wall biosynthesis
VVHIQGDFSSASLGTTLARRFDLPIVYTSHTNIDFGGEKVLGRPLTTLLLKFFSWQFAHFLKIPNRPAVKNGWEYMRFVQSDAQIAIAPSSHHARTIEGYGIASNVQVLLNGVDDDLLDQVVRTPREPGAKIRLAWAGRLLPEKRILEGIEAFAKAKVNAKLIIIGAGRLKKPARMLALRLGVINRVKFAGRLPHQQMLQALANADALLQTSDGFETQGLTVYEAAAVGTPSIICDALVAGELPAGSYWVAKSPEVEDLTAEIRSAVAALEQGDTRGEILPRELVIRQSELTARVIGIYHAAIAEKQPSE